MPFALALMAACLSSSKKQEIQTDLVKVSDDIQTLAERVVKLENRVKRQSEDFEKLEKTFSQTRADQSVLLEDMKIENKNIAGGLEVLKHELQSAISDNQRIREDFDFRISELEKKLSDSTASSPPRSQQESSGGESERYKQIMNLYSKKSFEKAATQFKSFSREYPKSSLAPNAQFFAGESLFAQKKYAQAIKEYQLLVDRFPNHEKTCEATYRQGLAFKALNKKENSKLFFTEAIERCKNPDIKKRAERDLKSVSPK